MRSPQSRSLLLSLLAALALAACGSEAESAPEESAPPEVAPTGAPWEQIPADSLYGATAVENLRTLPVVIDAINIPAGWNGMRIAAISDLHLGLWPDNERVATAALQRALAARPDLVVLLGDYVATEADTAVLARVLAPLRGKPVLAVLGDRDIRNDSLEAAVTVTLQRSGVRVLKNDAVPFTRNRGTAFIGGLDPDLAEKGFGDREYLIATIGGGARVPLLLAHNPLMALAGQEERYAAILSGHTFCGQAEVPGTPRLSWLTGEAIPGALVPGTERLFRIKKNTLFVTCGVGYSFMPVRLSAAPEVALITLEGTAAPEPQAAAPDTIIPDSVMDRFQRRDSTRTDSTQRDTAR